jgi:3,4-dihydroxy-9,10-secoandrosta-1,3,5(10)-triene-9,17-dione 4,5-dioxygenase
LGLEVFSRDAQRLYLRNDVNVFRICVQRDDAEDLIALGWAVADERDLDAFSAQLSARGIEVATGTRAEADLRHVLKLIRFRDPNGIINEIVWGVEIKEQRPFRSPVLLDGFVTQDMGFGHVVLSIDKLDDSVAFFRDALGHKVSTVARIAHFEAVFLRCNRRHHSVALSESRRPKRLQHLQIEYKTFDDIGRGLDRVQDQKIPMVATLGRHISDWVTSFYVRSPSGFVVELAYGSRVLPDDARTEFETFSGSLWGHRSGMENC